MDRFDDTINIGDNNDNETFELLNNNSLNNNFKKQEFKNKRSKFIEAINIVNESNIDSLSSIVFDLSKSKDMINSNINTNNKNINENKKKKPS